MNFFYLAHSEMSLRCLEGMIERSFKPSLVVISVKKGVNQRFKNEMHVICVENEIDLINVCDGCEHSDIRIMQSIDDLIPLIKNYDFGLSVGFMKILPKPVFTAPARGIINLHCGKLPEYRGRAPISRAIMEGEDSVTITIHVIDKGVDSGDIVEEVVIPVNDSDDVNTVYDKCCKASPDAAIKGIKKFVKGNSNFRKQAPDLRAREKISEDERKIKWNVPAREIFNKIRAITFPYPGATAYYGGREYIVLSSEIHRDKKAYGPPGTIISTGPGNVRVSAKEGSLILKDVFKAGSLIRDFKKEFTEGRSFK